MEHLLNPSGDGTYVPFARSQIKALRAAGQRYAARRWEMGQGWTVAVRIVADQEYIYISRDVATLAMDTGIVEGYYLGADAYATPNLLETASAAAYNASFIPTDPVSAWRVNDGPSGQYSGTLNRLVDLITGKVQYDNTPARSFSPGKDEDGAVIPEDPALLAKKIVASTCPASMFTGRCRLYIQAVYGRHLYPTPSQTEAGIFPTLAGTAQPALVMPPYESGGEEVTIDTSTGVYLDPATGKHWLFKIRNGGEVWAYLLISNGFGEGQRKKLITTGTDVPETPLNAEDREHLETFILSACRPHTKVIASGSLGSTGNYSMGYGWHWNWTGNVADIVITGTTTEPGHDPKMSSTHFRLTMTRTDAAWAVSLTTVEGPKSWAVERLNWCIAEPLWSRNKLIKSTPKYAELHGCDAPIYAFYNRDTLKTIRIKVDASTPAENSKTWDPPYFTTLAGITAGDVTTFKTLGMLGGWAETTSFSQMPIRNGVQWKARITIGTEILEDLYLGRQESGTRYEIKDKVLNGGIAGGFYNWDAGYSYSFGVAVAYYEGYPVSPGTWAVGGYERGLINIGIVMGVDYTFEASNVSNTYPSVATVIIPFYDAEAVYLHGNSTHVSTITGRVANPWVSYSSTSGIWAELAYAMREAGVHNVSVNGTIVGTTIDTDEKSTEYIKYDYHNHGAIYGNGGPYTTFYPDDSTTYNVLLEYRKLVCNAGAVNATFSNLTPFHDNSDQYDEISDVYAAQSGTRTDNPTVFAFSRIDPVGFNGHNAAKPVFVGWV